MEYKRKRLIRAALQKAEAKRKQTVRQAESAANTEQKTPEEYVDHLSVRETAAKLKVDDSTVSTHHKNARDKIRNAMEE